MQQIASARWNERGMAMNGSTAEKEQITEKEQSETASCSLLFRPGRPEVNNPRRL